MTSIKHTLQALLYFFCCVLLLWIVLGGTVVVAAIMIPFLCVQDAMKLFKNKQKGK